MLSRISRADALSNTTNIPRILISAATRALAKSVMLDTSRVIKIRPLFAAHSRKGGAGVAARPTSCTLTISTGGKSLLTASMINDSMFSSARKLSNVG
jgi:hypothetical protein